MADCIMSKDSDPMGLAFELAVNDSDPSGLAALVAYYRAKAAEANGRLANVERVIAAKDEIIRAKDEMIRWLMPNPISRGLAEDGDGSGGHREGA